ncbi:MAG: hypothetical protein KAR17_01000, partial [Cyclobacteriaceae bacterium]|nr:hypothetical protein [Cyclobacteriaceae bacterium]
EKFVGEFAQQANQQITRKYREPFVVPSEQLTRPISLPYIECHKLLDISILYGSVNKPRLFSFGL